jgi:hypothetical protein
MIASTVALDRDCSVGRVCPHFIKENFESYRFNLAGWGGKPDDFAVRLLVKGAGVNGDRVENG